MKVGDYVEVLRGEDVSGMPADRRDGLIVEVLGQYGWNRDPDQVLVMFSNGNFLRFHKSCIKVINESR